MAEEKRYGGRIVSLDSLRAPATPPGRWARRKAGVGPPRNPTSQEMAEMPRQAHFTPACLGLHRASTKPCVEDRRTALPPGSSWRLRRLAFKCTRMPLQTRFCAFRRSTMAWLSDNMSNCMPHGSQPAGSRVGPSGNAFRSPHRIVGWGGGGGGDMSRYSGLGMF